MTEFEGRNQGLSAGVGALIMGISGTKLLAGIIWLEF